MERYYLNITETERRHSWDALGRIYHRNIGVRCSYWSELLSNVERRYDVTEAEAKGMLDAIMHYSNYLVTDSFEVMVDHKCLLYLFKMLQQ